MEQKEKNAALLVMDMEAGILSGLPDITVLLNNIGEAIGAARRNGIPVIYAVIGFRAGAPEINTNNKMFSAGKERFTSANPKEFMKIHHDIAPLENEIIVTKRRVSAFTGSDLELVLRSLGIQHITLTGVATSGVVLSTLREASDKDFRITALSDCCKDRDDEVHNFLITKIFPRQADVITVKEWAADLSRL